MQAKVQHDRERILKNRARMEEDKALLLRDSGFFFPLSFFYQKHIVLLHIYYMIYYLKIYYLKMKTRPSSSATLVFFFSVFFQQKTHRIVAYMLYIMAYKNEKARPSSSATLVYFFHQFFSSNKTHHYTLTLYNTLYIAPPPPLIFFCCVVFLQENIMLYKLTYHMYEAQIRGSRVCFV